MHIEPNSFRKKHTARRYFEKLRKYLELPEIRLLIYSREESRKNNIGIFNTGKNGKPYIALWKLGWNKRVIQHELIHYVQYLAEGEKIWDVAYNGDPEKDPYEKEARSLQHLPKEQLKMYVEFRFFKKTH